MIFTLPNITQVIAKGLETFKRFPLALLSSILVTTIVIYFMEIEPRKLMGVNLILVKVAASAMLGMFVFTALRLLEHSISRQAYWIAFALGIMGLTVYYFSLPDETNGFDALLYIFRHIFLILLFFVSILWTPFIYSSLSNVDYWVYAKGVLFSLVMTVLFSVVFIIGVNVALFAIEELFDFYIKGKYYFIVDVFIVGVFSVTYFLSQIPSKPLAAKASMQPPRVEKFFTQYILTPLTGIYFIILYAYSVKVLVTMDWPKGVLAWLIVAFSTVAVLTYLFWTHFTTFQTSKWRKWIWLAVFLQTLMLFAAIGMRILDYSWTENRYMVLMLGVWFAGISLYFLLYKEAKVKWIFISLSILIAISQVGPLSAYEVSKKSQTQRLMYAVESYNQEKSYGENVPVKVRYEISDITQYLFNRYGIKALEPVFPKITAEFKILDKRRKTAEKKLRDQMQKEKNKYKVVAASKKEDYQIIQDIFKDKPRYLPYFITHELGFKFMNFWDLNNERNGVIQNYNFSVMTPRSAGNKALNIQGYDYMSHYYGNSYNSTHTRKQKSLYLLENIGIGITFTDGLLKIHKDKQSIVLDVNAYIDALVKKHGVHPKILTQKDLTLEKENDILKVKIEFQHLNKNNYKGNKQINFNSSILYKLKRDKK